MTRKSPTIGGRHKADSTPSEYIRSLIRDDQDLAGNSEVALLIRRWESPAEAERFLGVHSGTSAPSLAVNQRALVIGDTEKGAREWGQRAKSGGGYRSNCRTGERPFAQYWPFPASPCRRAVNQKGREFVVR